MPGLAPEGSQFDARQFDTKMNELLTADGQEFFTSYDEVYESFDLMGFQEKLLRGIYAIDFEKPSAIQQRGIVPFCKGLDAIQQAESGTGKTTTFCPGILQQLDYVMAGLAPERSQFDARQFDTKMNELLTADGQEFFTSYDEVYESFDIMGLNENLLRGNYTYGFEKPSGTSGTGMTTTFCSGILQQLDYGTYVDQEFQPKEDKEKEKNQKKKKTRTRKRRTRFEPV